MTYCNQENPKKDRRKHKQPSVSLCALDRERREAEIEEWMNNLQMKMPIAFDTGTGKGITVHWPKKFR